MAKEMFDKSNLNAGATDELNKLPDGGPFAVINLLRYNTPGRRASRLLLATLPIRDTGQHSRGGRDGAAEASAVGIVRKVRLSVLLAGVPSDIKARVEQQRVAGRNGVG